VCEYITVVQIKRNLPKAFILICACCNVRKSHDADFKNIDTELLLTKRYTCRCCSFPHNFDYVCSSLNPCFLVRSLLWLAIILFLTTSIYSQSYQWASKIGGTGSENSSAIYTDNKGFVYVVGYFQGTVDFDPSTSATANLISQGGSQDAFVAKYTTGGQYVWAFRIGGTNLDATNAVTVDPLGNVYVTGFFRGQSIDFDPSVTGVATLNSNGEGGGDPGYGGDIFIAKYNSSGQYLWAFNVGGTSLGDNGTEIVSDNAGNIYASGYFRESPDFDPSGTSVKNLNASTGTIWVAKYNTTGQYQWAFNMGLPDQDNTTFGMKIDASANIYLTGFFQGTNVDFNPSPTATAPLSSNGNFETFVAKYTSAGDYSWAFSIGGSGLDVGRDIEIDSAGNVYVAGDFDGANVDFDPSPTSSSLLSSNGRDVFIAKYNPSGQYQWAKRFGASGSDISWSLAYSAYHIYITGSFQGTMNFSPGPTVDNLVSNGGYDFYMTKFDLAGNYICAFSAGGSSNDDAYSIDADNLGNLYTAGTIASSSVDFNPGTGVNTLSTTGSTDVFIAKYTWPDNTAPTGSLSGNTICVGQQGQLTFTATTGVGPFTLQYSNGSATYIQNNVQSGVPFNLSPNPGVTTMYTLISIKDGLRCSPTNNAPASSTAVTIASGGNLADFGFVQNACDPHVFEFRAIDGIAPFTWNFGDATTGTGNTVTKTFLSYGNYPVKLKMQSTSGCVDSVTKSISVGFVQGNQILSADTTICKGSSLKVTADAGAGLLCWKTDPTIQNSAIANTTVTPTRNTTYYFSSQNTIGANLVNNENFSSGSSGFTSEYISSVTNSAADQFSIGTNPFFWNASLGNCTDHTTAAGNMMLVRSSAVTGKKIWSQDITVQQNTNYVFSCWVQSLSGANLPSLKFSIKGQNVSGSFSSPAGQCNWGKSFVVWNSGVNTSVNIALTNSNSMSESYFAIDDLVFAPISSMRYDSLNVSIADPPIVFAGADTSVCPGGSVQLNASGGTFYNWSAAAGLNNAYISNPVATPTATTEYIVSAYDLPGCSATDTVKVDVLRKPSLTVTKDTSMCSGSQMQLNASGGTTYEWFPATGLNASNIPNPIASPLNNIKYQVTSYGVNGCSASDSVTVMVSERPLISVRSDTTICKGNSAQLSAKSNISATFSWSPTSGLNNPLIDNPVAAPSNLTTYIVTASSSAGCFSTDSVKLDVLPLPSVVKSADTIICASGSAALFASGGTSYNWYPSTGLSNPLINNPVAAPLTSTVYHVTVTGTNGCSTADSLSINVKAKPAFSLLPVNPKICMKDTVVLTAAGGNTYNWLPAPDMSNSASSSPKVYPTTTTVYAVAITDASCRLTDTLFTKVTVASLPNVTISKTNDIDCYHSSTRLSATGGVSYIWSPIVSLSSAATASPIASPTSNTTYSVKVTNSSGCSKTDTIAVKVNYAASTSGFELPSAFTPNSDGKNDCFGVKSWGPVSKLQFAIYNRWGERVFYSSDASKCWDGTYNGIPQPMGAFVYVVSASTICGGELYRKGTVVLIR
jgi:gliding motility-associated-like protein